MKRKYRPLSETPRDGVFCGPGKYLKLQEYSISEEMFPVIEFDSYFILVRGGTGIFVINGEEFSVRPGCVCWIQSSQVLTICPDFGDTLDIWVCAFEYQLLSYFLFNNISSGSEVTIVTGRPVLEPESDAVKEIVHLFEEFKVLSKKSSCGSAVIRSSFLRKIEILYNRAAHTHCDKYKFDDIPLSRKVSLYIAAHSTANLTASGVAEAIAPGVDETAINHALLVATGFNFNQFLNRMRICLAMSYFLYDSLPFDYIASISGFNMDITFFRRFKAITGTTPQNYLNSLLCDGQRRQIYRGMIMSETLISAISYLYENMSEPIDAETLAKELYTSENILRVQFKSRYNSSYKQVLSLFRVRYAEALLTTTELPTVDIAMETGFGSAKTMGRVFQSINGISPGEFKKQRKMMRGGNG